MTKKTTQPICRPDKASHKISWLVFVPANQIASRISSTSGLLNGGFYNILRCSVILHQFWGAPREGMRKGPCLDTKSPNEAPSQKGQIQTRAKDAVKMIGVSCFHFSNYWASFLSSTFSRARSNLKWGTVVIYEQEYCPVFILQSRQSSNACPHPCG